MHYLSDVIQGAHMELKKSVSVSQAQESLPALLEAVKEYGVLLTTDDNVPAAVLLNVNTFRSMQAAIFRAANTELNAKANRAYHDIQEGKVSGFQEVDLGFENKALTRDRSV